ncbi:DUF6919 domain-containing protein [Kitasatospora sp. NPDC059811]|uniref:DUF6919 domain-containing protein n=1 Tax=Streptomycetaceae TaxID=2062 RepID=UPI0007AFC5C3|nr:hypothetical protein [Streptomyces sp. MJM8645]
MLRSLRDRWRWRAARTAADLGELTAQWLEGRIKSHPALIPAAGPDEETTGTPELFATLLLANRCGYVTDFSQPGCRDVGADGQWWSQIAAVSGFVTDPDVLNRLRVTAQTWGLNIREYRCTYLGPLPEPIVVTERAYQAHTWAGRARAAREVRWLWRGVGRPAVRAMELAWQVTLAEASPSSGGILWRALGEAFGDPAACQRCACTPYKPCRERGCWLTTQGGETLCWSCAWGHPGDTAPDDFGDGDQDDDFEDFWGEPEESECDLCGAPFCDFGRYCTQTCEEADAPDPEHSAVAETVAETVADPEHFTVLGEDPWSTAPRT